MPQIKIERIVTFSSEDTTHTAQNILSNDTSKKWKCKSPGEKNASIVLQLDQPYIIHSIDIGNENSAYIEVLGARSSTPDEFKVLLVMSSFMSPMEARQSQNINKVRMFKHDDLSAPERDEKWDRIKVVCTQPFNRHVQYGLSFINLYCSEDNPVDRKKVGKFALRPESPTTFSPGSLFAKRKQMQETLKGAAAIRATMGSPVPKPKIKAQLMQHTPKKQEEQGDKRQERNRNEILYSKEEEDKHEKIDRIIERRDKLKQEQDKTKNLTPDKAKPKQQQDKSDTPNKPKVLVEKRQTPKRKHSPSPKHRKPKKFKLTKPFSRLLENVVLVISGIQNPDRASLRTMALSMGAKYKPDWDATCTHLICAFANTPKFNQVKGKGKIVTSKWIEECYNQRKRLPWRRFCLDKGDRGDDSEEEIWEDCPETTPSPQTDDETLEQGSDTEDKVQRVLAKQSIYDVDTDVDDPIEEPSFDCTIKQKFANFFQDKVFYIDESFQDEMQDQIRQYIVAYNGTVVENLEVSIEIIVTNEDNYQTLKDLYPSAHCVAPDWIWECHNCQKMVDMTEFLYA